MKLLKTLLTTFLFTHLAPGIASVENYFSKIKSDQNALYTFLKEMPKGGELHYHLAGGAYPEAMLKLTTKDDFCLSTDTFTVSENKKSCNGIQINKLKQNTPHYVNTIRAWSMQDFVPGQESGHDHFFNSFYKFMPIVFNYRAQLLTEIMERAENQQEQYLEVMILSDNGKSIQFANQINTVKKLNEKKRRLLANQAFQDNITYTIEESENTLQQARQQLGCNKISQSKACQLNVKFQYYVLREQPLDQVFAQALNAFAAASRSNTIVGVNLVQAEDGVISLRDYREQMKIFKFLHNAYPNVHIALHAGELTPDAVTPKDLRFHIYDAIHIGQAERIGHGVDITYEHNAGNLVKHMAKKSIPVEINLTSNQTILNIPNRYQHPLRYYLANQVPVVLSTDDEGILRTNLTSEYVKAVTDHDVDYLTLKQINRNALTYSFLPGKSLWADSNKAIPIKDCKDLTSLTCQIFIKKNEKTRIQLQLEKKLSHFETQY